MNDYTKIAPYYDLYVLAKSLRYRDAIGPSLERYIVAGDRVLEVGVGTGLAIEQLRAHCQACDLTGIDHTEAMLTIARERVGKYCKLVQVDVRTMDLRRTFDVIFSCAGVWSLIDAGTELQLCSYIPDEDEDRVAFGNVLGHLRSGGLFLLSVHEMHKDKEGMLPGGVTYRQSIRWCGTLLQKEYYFEGPAGIVTHHNTFHIRQQSDMEAFLCQHGMVALPKETNGILYAFRKDAPTESIER